MKTIWNKWKKIAEKIGNFQFNLIFSVFYFLLLTPLSVIAKVKDPLNLKSKPKWQKYDLNQNTIGELKQQ